LLQGNRRCSPAADNGEERFCGDFWEEGDQPKRGILDLRFEGKFRLGF
jgi:hypothetical protein